LNDDLNVSNAENFKVIVYTGKDHDKRIELNDYARHAKSYFIAADTVGLFGFTFNDFGNQFHVSDTTGENAVSGMISAVSKVMKI
jgi:ubiquitin-activating enzyme E1